ncbi:MAG: acyl-CoA desaturase [Bacteroidetes bacterium]|nr:MAG: acyl-CoA desaturase [Bacteroidota bacterium]
MQKISFARNHNDEFYKDLQSRIRAYFKENNRDRHADREMKWKTVAMLTWYLLPFILILTVFEHPLLITLSWVAMGFGMAGVGLSIMHDANHGAYSKKEKVNTYLGQLLYLLGGNDVNWKIQHNVLHHTYTNVTGVDEDISPGKILRFSPRAERKGIHRFQHIYAWFFYGLMTIMWITVKDYKQAFRYRKMDLVKTQRIKNFAGFVGKIVLSKLIYFTIFLGLPMYFSPLSWWATLLCFLMMHFICGLVLAMIFQPAHVVPSSSYPVPDESGNIEADWAVNQLFNTANFAPNSKWFSWYVGGLNYQIEHHLFPTICHTHYKKIARIVAQTAKEYNLPYISQKTFWQALREHTRMLKNLGRYDLAPGI